MVRRMFAALVVAAMMATTVHAQTIQLPSFHATGVNTTVVVPDSGGAYVARDRQVNYGFSTFGGLPRNQGWGIRRQAASIGVTAQIHDPAAADAALGGSLVRRAPAASAASTLQIGVGRAADDAPLASVVQLERRRAEQAAAADREVLALVEKGRQARAAGKASVAAIYFRMAARHATGELRQEIETELGALAVKRAAAGNPAQAGRAAAGPSSTRTAAAEK